MKYLNSLSANKATGLDSIPSRFMRDSASIIASPLTHIINFSIIQGVAPDDLKSARVVLCPSLKKNKNKNKKQKKNTKLRWQLSASFDSKNCIQSF